MVLSEEELRAEFEATHAGRNLTRHGLRGTYTAAPIAALWNQHVKTARFMEGRVLGRFTRKLIQTLATDVLIHCYGTSHFDQRMIDGVSRVIAGRLEVNIDIEDHEETLLKSLIQMLKYFEESTEVDCFIQEGLLDLPHVMAFVRKNSDVFAYATSQIVGRLHLLILNTLFSNGKLNHAMGLALGGMGYPIEPTNDKIGYIVVTSKAKIFIST